MVGTLTSFDVGTDVGMKVAGTITIDEWFGTVMIAEVGIGDGKYVAGT